MKSEISSKRAINSFQLKILGLLFMTFDHIAAYTFNLSIGYNKIRIIGRVAAPLFLYVIINSFHNTRNKLKYAFRLYIAHVSICLTTLLLTTKGKKWFGIHDQFSILSTFVYTVLFIWLIENIIEAIKENKKRTVLSYSLLGVGIVVLPVILLILFSQYEELLTIIFPNVLTVPYSPIFVIMGICWYFIKNRKWQGITLIIFSCFAAIGGHIISRVGIWMFMNFFNSNQFWMILFLPFMFLYNGEKGKSFKYFFYIYYPLHVFLLMFIGQQLNF
ncbi:TraX family protein [Maledivibacter halophilus]|uniref:TraX protein n=1 Tax=Maledivibacter halophilus TaxID=36842 RepID=A0A1T5M505_9FIRM|nr:TraX family protein [Maledivibacter halophilus]SKC82949.1 TraX protein [Maledivibacter halophilus]